jgi:uncharacterized protein YodC (DUF2158 family)
MKHDHLTDEQIQAAIDAACRETHAKHRIDIGTNLVLDTKAMPGTWKNEAHARRDLLKSALERLPEPIRTTMNFTPFTGDELATIKSLMAAQELDATQVLRQALRHYQMAAQGKPEPTPPVVDGKTPGQVAFENFQQRGLTAWSDSSYQKNYEAAATAVLAAFGGNLEAAIARMEAVPVEELEDTYFDNASMGAENVQLPDDHDCALKAVRARLIAAARAEKAEADLTPPSPPQLRPIAEAGPVPEGCVRVFFNASFVPFRHRYSSDTHFADIRLPSPAASQDSQPAEADPYAELKKAHAEGKVVEFNPGDSHGWRVQRLDWTAPVECYRIKPEPAIATLAQDQIQATPAMQAAADAVLREDLGFAPAWQPAVGDTVRLKSGGPAMTVMDEEKNGEFWCSWFYEGEVKGRDFPAACLTPAKEEQP